MSWDRQFLGDLSRQRLGFGLVCSAGAVCLPERRRHGLRKAHIEGRQRQPFGLARDHPNRSGDGRLDPIGQRFVMDAHGAIRDDVDMKLCQPLIDQRLAQEQQRIEALFLQPVKEAGPGAVAFVGGDAPEMRDAAG